MYKNIISVLIICLLLFCSCFNEKSNNSEEDPKIQKIHIYDSSDTSSVPYHIGNYLFSNTGAKTEDFIVYDGTTEQSILPYCDGCKIHSSEYHSYAAFGIAKLRSNEEARIFSKKYWLSNTLINGKTPICEGYNQIQMIWDLGITPIEIEQLLGSYEDFCKSLREIGYSEKELLAYKAYYMGPKDNINDEDIDFIQKAWKNPFCVYVNKIFFTLDWLNENTAQDYFKYNLPLDQLEEIYALRNEDCPFVNFLGVRIDEYKSLLKGNASTN